MDVQKLLAILAKNINEEQLAKDLAQAFIVPAIDKVVADSANKLDDLAWAAIKQAVGI